MLRTDHAVFEKHFQKTAVWPWFQFQLGEKAAAQSSLAASFDEEFQRVMALKEASFFLGRGPLTPAEFLLRGLKAVAPAEKFKLYESRMIELKVHVSNLPQMGVTT